MRNLVKIFITIIFVINGIFINSYAYSNNYIEESLEQLDIPKEYSENIAKYISELNLSDEEIDDFSDKSKLIFSNIKSRLDDGEITISEAFKSYSELANLAKELNLDIDIDFSNKEVGIVDKNTNITLFKCSKSEAEKYIDNYKKLSTNENYYSEVMDAIKEEASANELNNIEENQLKNNTVENEKKNKNIVSEAENNRKIMYNYQENIDSDTELVGNNVKVKWIFIIAIIGIILILIIRKVINNFIKM